MWYVQCYKLVSEFNRSDLTLRIANICLLHRLEYRASILTANLLRIVVLIFFVSCHNNRHCFIIHNRQSYLEIVGASQPGTKRICKVWLHCVVGRNGRYGDKAFVLCDMEIMIWEGGRGGGVRSKQHCLTCIVCCDSEKVCAHMAYHAMLCDAIGALLCLDMT